MTEEEKDLALQAALKDDFKTLAEILEGRSFNELLDILEFSSEVIRLAKELRDQVIVQADATSLHADRTVLADVAKMSRPTLYSLLERRGRPTNRKKT